jgi:hypothetical protein
MANTVILDFLACDVVFGTGLIIFILIMQVDDLFDAHSIDW